MAFSLADYEIIAEIGRGGYGSVLRARQKNLGREVAIKQLAGGRMQESGEIMRFRREAEAMAALAHDNIVVVFDHGYHGGSYYIVMEYIDGMSFDAALNAGLGTAAGLHVLEKCATGLAYAHAENIIHRDIKPANILLGKNGQIKVADFGLAVLTSGSPRFTGTGMVLGTLNFLAPEALVSPKEIDARVDVFAFGCIIYRVIAGVLPFDGETVGDISYRLLNQEPVPIEGRAVSPQLVELTMACLHKDREKRPSMRQVQETIAAEISERFRPAPQELAAFLRSRNPTSRQPTPSSVALTEKVVKAPVTARRPLNKVLIIGAAAVVVIAIAVVLLAFNEMLPWQPKADGSLPEVTGLTAADTTAAPVVSGVVQPASGDAPKPIDGSEANSATLILDRVAREDSILLDGRPLKRIASGHRDSTEMAPGSYRVEIKRQGESIFSRELTLSSRERIELNITDKAPTHGQ